MHRPVTPKDLIAPLLLWALVLFGCVAGDVRPTHSPVRQAACLR